MKLMAAPSLTVHRALGYLPLNIEAAKGIQAHLEPQYSTDNEMRDIIEMVQPSDPKLYSN